MRVNSLPERQVLSLIKKNILVEFGNVSIGRLAVLYDVPLYHYYNIFSMEYRNTSDKVEFDCLQYFRYTFEDVLLFKEMVARYEEKGENLIVRKFPFVRQIKDAFKKTLAWEGAVTKFNRSKENGR